MSGNLSINREQDLFELLYIFLLFILFIHSLIVFKSKTKTKKY